MCGGRLVSVHMEAAVAQRLCSWGDEEGAPTVVLLTTYAAQTVANPLLEVGSISIFRMALVDKVSSSNVLFIIPTHCLPRKTADDTII